MKRSEERIQSSLSYANNQQDIPIKDEFSRLLCIALGQAYLKGAEWADKTMLDRICNWLKNNTDITPTGIKNLLKSMEE